MAVQIDLIDETGQRVASARDVHDFVDRVLQACASGSNVLQLVEPYEDFIVRADQLDGLREDWKKAEPVIASEHDRAAWADVNALASRAEAELGNQLRFLAD